MPVTNGFVDVAYGIALTGDPELMFVTLAWEAVGPIPSTEALEGHYGRFATRIRTLYSNVFTFSECRFTFGTPSGNVPIVINPEAPVSGNRGSVNHVPNNVAYLVRKQTALGGRRNRGRMFFPSPEELGVNSVGTLTTAERNLVQAAIDNWQADEQAATLGWDPVLLHSDGGAPTTITGFQVQPRIATQRRRLRP